MSMKNRQIEILEFLGHNTTATKMEIFEGLHWSNWEMTKKLIQHMKFQNLLQSTKESDPGLNKFSLTVQGAEALQMCGG